jgi:hypothetical protein
MGFILGLQGAAKAGKDTTADYLIEEHGWDGKLSFAKNLKDMCRAIFFLSEDDVNTQKGKERVFSKPKVFTQRNLGSVLYWMSTTHSRYPIVKGAREHVASLVGTELTTPRHILQFIGTDVCRAVIPSYHLDIVVNTIRDNPDKNYIITDVRFPNEGDLVLDELDGLVVQIVREANSDENIDRSHKSETAMSDWGRFTDVVDNQKDGLPFLYAEVNNLLKRQNLCQETTTQLSKSAKESSSPTAGSDVLSATGTIKITNSTSADSE